MQLHEDVLRNLLGQHLVADAVPGQAVDLALVTAHQRLEGIEVALPGRVQQALVAVGQDRVREEGGRGVHGAHPRYTTEGTPEGAAEVLSR